MNILWHFFDTRVIYMNTEFESWESTVKISTTCRQRELSDCCVINETVLNCLNVHALIIHTIKVRINNLLFRSIGPKREK